MDQQLGRARVHQHTPRSLTACRHSSSSSRSSSTLRPSGQLAARHPNTHPSAAAAAAAALRDDDNDPATATSSSSSTTSTALQVRRLQQLQDMLGDTSAQQQTAQQPTVPRSSKQGKSAGFGGGSGSSSSHSKHHRHQHHHQQQQQRVDVMPQGPCPCKSGLRYQDCCQPFLSGLVQPRSAPELARARISAALTGDVAYLVSTTHPDSSLALGGSRDLASRTRSQAATFKENKPAVIGMAHCRGDEEDTWLVLTILQATAGQLAGTKAPVMYVMARRGNNNKGSPDVSEQQTHKTDSSSSSKTSKRRSSPDEWLYMGQTTKLPQHQDSEALVQLLQLHVPEALQGDDDAGSSSSSGGMISREVLFVWTEPTLNLPTSPESAAARVLMMPGSTRGASGGSQRQWYLDLLEPAAEPLHAHSHSSSRPRDGAAADSAAGAAASIPSSRRAGVVSMDAEIEARRGLGHR